MKDRIYSRSTKLLLVDCLGAGISFVLLAFVLTHYQSHVGIPKSVLWTLALPPAMFVFFDLFALFTMPSRRVSALRTIAFFNLLYCATSLVLCYMHSTTITALGWCYILGEILLVLLLARFEWHTARALSQT